MPDTPSDPIEAAIAAADAAAAAEVDGQPAPEPPAEPAAEEPGERRFAGRYTSVEELERAHDELNRTLGSMGDRAGTAERRAQELESQLQAFQQQNQGQPAGPAPDTGQRQFLENGTPILTAEELADLAQEDPWTAAQLQTQYEVARMREEMRAEFQQAQTPFVSVVNDMAAGRALDVLKESVGAELFAEHKDALREAIEHDPSYFADPQTQVTRMKQAIFASAYQAQQGGGTTDRPRDESGKFVHVEGGSRGAPATAFQPATGDDDADIAALKSYKPRSDAFGVVPVRTP
jgi:hypothetical protein